RAVRPAGRGCGRSGSRPGRWCRGAGRRRRPTHRRPATGTRPARRSTGGARSASPEIVAFVDRRLHLDHGLRFELDAVVVAHEGAAEERMAKVDVARVEDSVALDVPGATA